MDKKDDYYITFLKYARDMMKEGKTPHFTEAFDHVHNVHPMLRQDAFQMTFFQAMDAVAGQQGIGASYVGRIEQQVRHMITLESYFHLLEHEELKQARQSSQEAKWIAIAAIGISGLLAAFSIVQSALY